MSDKNIDKDIVEDENFSFDNEDIKEIIEENIKLEEEIFDIKRKNFYLIQHDVILQEEIKKLNFKLKEKICFESNSQFKDLEEKLYIQENITEKWVKIAEKLAGISRCVNVSDNECHKKTCEQCVIDWARKEVEKDEPR